MAGSPYYFDQAVADAAVAFFPKFLRLVEAEWAGRPFRLADWQAHHTAQIFGWRRYSDGTRRYRRVRGWVPKKNGKSEWMAGVAHLACVGDNEPGAYVPVYATDKAQAGIIFEKASRMVSLDINRETGAPGPLARLYEQLKTGLFCPHLMSSIVALSGEATGKHGPAPHVAIGDEVHEWTDGTLHRFVVEGMASRRQPLDILISTAGELKTFAHEEYENSKAILADPSLDPECYVFIYEAEEDDDWTDPKVWAKANPNYPVSPKHDFLESECRQAQRIPRLQNDFLRYHLNRWVAQQKRWFPMRLWGANTARPDDPDYWKALPELCRGRRCCGGLDLGSTSDITCDIYVFPPAEEGGRTILVPIFWVPEETVELRDSPRTPYKKWVAEGALLTTPGNVTDYDFIERQIVDDVKRFDIERLGYDPWNATQVAIHLQDEGLPMTEFRQGFASMAAPSKELERLFLAGLLEHGNHPVLKWMFGNAAYKKDPAGNIKPDKEKAAEKIDGVVGAVMGVGLANAATAPAGRGIMEFYKQAAAANPQVKSTTAVGTARLRAPAGTSTVYGMSGRQYVVGADGIVEVTEEDAKPLLGQGFEHIVAAET